MVTPSNRTRAIPANPESHDTVEANKADVTHKEDLCLAAMNLISIEEHLAFTAMKTGKHDYLDILEPVRQLRIKILKPLIHNTEGELWCISKHLLAGTMRCMEVASRYAGKDNNTAMTYEKAALDLYGLFWLLQTKEETTNHAESEKSPAPCN